MKRSDYDMQVEVIEEQIKALREEERRIAAIYQGMNEYSNLKDKVVTVQNRLGLEPYKPFYFDGLKCDGSTVYAKGFWRKKDGSKGDRKLTVYLGKADKLVEVKQD